MGTNLSPTVAVDGYVGLLTSGYFFCPLCFACYVRRAPISSIGGGRWNGGNPVTFSVLFGPGHVFGNWASMWTGVGTIVVAANQAGNADIRPLPR